MIILRIPARYMRADATEDEKKIFTLYKEKTKEIYDGIDRVLILPSDRDPETRQYLFDVEVK